MLTATCYRTCYTCHLGYMLASTVTLALNLKARNLNPLTFKPKPKADLSETTKSKTYLREVAPLPAIGYAAQAKAQAGR